MTKPNRYPLLRGLFAHCEISFDSPQARGVSNTFLQHQSQEDFSKLLATLPTPASSCCKAPGHLLTENGKRVSGDRQQMLGVALIPNRVAIENIMVMERVQQLCFCRSANDTLA